MDQVVNLLDEAAKAYPIKALCDEIGKAESTLRNELKELPGYKLGLRTSAAILRKTGDLRALDRLEHLLGRVAFVLPRADKTAMAPVVEMAGDLAREFGEHMQELGSAIIDGRITRDEARACLKELFDLIAACVKLQAYLLELVK